MSTALRLSLLGLSLLGLTATLGQELDQVCTPAFKELGQERLYGTQEWNGARVLIIGCEERLSEMTPTAQAELITELSDFIDRNGWTFWWAAKNRDTRLEVMSSTEGFRAGDFTDFLLYDPVSGEP